MGFGSPFFMPSFSPFGFFFVPPFVLQGMFLLFMIQVVLNFVAANRADDDDDDDFDYRVRK